MRIVHGYNILSLLLERENGRRYWVSWFSPGEAPLVQLPFVIASNASDSARLMVQLGTERPASVTATPEQDPFCRSLGRQKPLGRWRGGRNNSCNQKLTSIPHLEIIYKKKFRGREVRSCELETTIYSIYVTAYSILFRVDGRDHRVSHSSSLQFPNIKSHQYN